MQFRKVVPILYASNVLRSLDYYTQVLGFEHRWDWGEPPGFGGVWKDTVEVYFCERGQGSPGTWLTIQVEEVDAYHDAIKSRGANVLVPPVNREWGMREMLVQDPDAHMIRFGMGVSHRNKSLDTPPAHIQLVEKQPELEVFQSLIRAVGWNTDDPATAQWRLDRTSYTVVAEDMLTGEIIGCAQVATDGANFYYVKNVLVLPAWQGRRIGEALMQQLTQWLDRHAVKGAPVFLYTGQNLAPFYQSFGFQPVYGMVRKSDPGE